MTRARPAQPPRVLVAATDDDVRLLCQVILGFEGLEVTAVGDAHDVPRLARRHLRPAVIVIQLSVTDPRSWDCLTTLRADRGVASIPVVVLASFSEDRLKVRALALGAAECVMMPFSNDDLRNAVRRVMDGDVRSREAARVRAIRRLRSAASRAR